LNRRDTDFQSDYPLHNCLCTNGLYVSKVESFRVLLATILEKSGSHGNIVQTKGCFGCNEAQQQYRRGLNDTESHKLVQPRRFLGTAVCEPLLTFKRLINDLLVFSINCKVSFC